jgi:serine/threonine protein kinase
MNSNSNFNSNSNSNTYLEKFINNLRFSLNKFSYLKKNFSQEELDNCQIEKIYFACNKIFKIIINKNNKDYYFAIKSTLFIWGETNNEYEILENIKDPNHTTKIYEYINENNTLYYLIEYISKSDNNLELLHRFKYIIESLKELHDNNLIHLDIHKNNFLYDSEKKIYKVIDFELAKMKGENFDISRMFGNSYKYPPEINDNKRADIYIDIFGLAPLFYELVYSRNMFMCKEDYVNKNILLKNQDNCDILIKYIIDNYQKINCDDILNFIKKNFDL